MNDSPEYIEAYFEKQLDEAEMRQFELRCEQDDLFARDVALYITTREAVKQILADQKKQVWRAFNPEEKTSVISAPVRKMSVRRWLPYAAAACLVLVMSLYFFSDQKTLNKQVAMYVQNEMSTFSQTMGTLQDSLSLEQGKSAFTKNDYNQALHIFTRRAQLDESDWEAKMYSGLVYLKIKNYDSALIYFKGLSGMQLQSNLGPYYTALTYLVRNKKGDREKAAQALKTVLSGDHYDRKKEARELLDQIE